LYGNQDPPSSIVNSYVPPFPPVTELTEIIPDVFVVPAQLVVYDMLIAGYVDVSFIVTTLDVATILPLTLPVLTYTKNDSAPSVIWSAVIETLKLPALLLIVKLPLVEPKSKDDDEPLVFIVQ
jgi:hypothetical protein